MPDSLGVVDVTGVVTVLPPGVVIVVVLPPIAAAVAVAAFPVNAESVGAAVVPLAGPGAMAAPQTASVLKLVTTTSVTTSS